MELQGSELQAVLITLISLAALLFISNIWLWMRVGRMNRRYKAVMNGIQVENVEELLVTIQHELTGLKEHDGKQKKQIEMILQRLQTMKSHLGFVRYNAFAQQGSELSFSLAILDEEQDGIVLTGIHSREDSHLYAKPVEKGQSSYALSPEEKTVIGQAASQRRSHSDLGSRS